MVFEEVLPFIKQGYKATRSDWNGSNQYVVLVEPSKYEIGSSIESNPNCLRPFFALKNSQGDFQPGWVPSTGDLLSDKWQINLDSR